MIPISDPVMRGAFAVSSDQTSARGGARGSASRAWPGVPLYDRRRSLENFWSACGKTPECPACQLGPTSRKHSRACQNRRETWNQQQRTSNVPSLGPDMERHRTSLDWDVAQAIAVADAVPSVESSGQRKRKCDTAQREEEQVEDCQVTDDVECEGPVETDLRVVGNISVTEEFLGDLTGSHFESETVDEGAAELAAQASPTYFVVPESVTPDVGLIAEGSGAMAEEIVDDAGELLDVNGSAAADEPVVASVKGVEVAPTR